MNQRKLLYAVATALALVLVLLFVYPHALVAPGNMIEGHESLKNDCFACHTLLLGSQPSKCLNCHELEKIGRLTTTGRPIAHADDRPAFHQSLTDQNCMACHVEHPTFISHRNAPTFAHSMLSPDMRERCTTCHSRPDDSLHMTITDNCQQCHSQQQWEPATFDHAKYFALDRDHNVTCNVCHADNDFKRYSCYGCHEHRPEKVRREHLEEGIREFDNCVECHRSADEDDARRPQGTPADD